MIGEGSSEKGPRRSGVLGSSEKGRQRNGVLGSLEKGHCNFQKTCTVRSSTYLEISPVTSPAKRIGEIEAMG